jgi:hypothetical protein
MKFNTPTLNLISISVSNSSSVKSFLHYILLLLSLDFVGMWIRKRVKGFLKEGKRVFVCFRKWFIFVAGIKKKMNL